MHTHYGVESRSLPKHLSSLQTLWKRKGTWGVFICGHIRCLRHLLLPKSSARKSTNHSQLYFPDRPTEQPGLSQTHKSHCLLRTFKHISQNTLTEMLLPAETEWDYQRSSKTNRVGHCLGAAHTSSSCCMRAQTKVFLKRPKPVHFILIGWFFRVIPGVSLVMDWWWCVAHTIPARLAASPRAQKHAALVRQTQSMYSCIGSGAVDNTLSLWNIPVFLFCHAGGWNWAKRDETRQDGNRQPNSTKQVRRREHNRFWVPLLI